MLCDAGYYVNVDDDDDDDDDDDWYNTDVAGLDTGACPIALAK